MTTTLRSYLDRRWWIKHFLFLGFPMAISHKLFWFIVFPKSFFGSLHSQWPFLVQGTAMGNTPRNSNWEHGEPKKTPINSRNLLLLHLVINRGIIGISRLGKETCL
jgi:hypothetical protein